MMRTKMVTALACVVFAAVGTPAEETSGSVAIRVVGDHIDFHCHGKLVGRYHVSPELAKPHFHPLNGPFGDPVTRRFPMEPNVPGESRDHRHHRGAWFCHGDVIPEGIELKHRIRGVRGVDFWSEHEGHGKIVCVDVGQPESVGSDRAWVTTKNEWRTADGQKVLDETRRIHLHDLGDAWLFVLDIDLHASVVPITFGDTKEGAMGVRVADSMTERRKQGGVLENADGKRHEGRGGNRDRQGVWGLQSRWCDYSGPVNDHIVGIAILDHPKNPYRACWHARGYGLMAANPFGRQRSGFPAVRGRTDLVHLNRGEHLHLRYGILIHRGDARRGRVEEHYRTFASLSD